MPSAKTLPSTRLAAKIEELKIKRPGLSTEDAYRLVKKEDAQLIKAFSEEIGFSLSSSEENWVPVR